MQTINNQKLKKLPNLQTQRATACCDKCCDRSTSVKWSGCLWSVWPWLCISCDWGWRHIVKSVLTEPAWQGLKCLFMMTAHLRAQEARNVPFQNAAVIKTDYFHDLWSCQRMDLDWLTGGFLNPEHIFLLPGQKGESRNENGTETWDFKTRQLNRGRGGRGETDIANQKAKVTGWHQRIPLGL